MRDAVSSPLLKTPDETVNRLTEHGNFFTSMGDAKLSSCRAIEDDNFPIEILSRIAEAESWRKEINRPLSHIHKWWAQRLGSVFRAIAIGVFSPSGTDIMSHFYEAIRIDRKVVFDPFMGSGTTLTEVTKLGGRAVGRDINPVATFLVRTALSRHNREAIENEFQSIENDVSDQISQYYRYAMPDESMAKVLYYFWVKIVECPNCNRDVDLFGNYIFARHACPSRHPTARAVCPNCGEINETRYDATELICRDCKLKFNPQIGPAGGQKATCLSCSEGFLIGKQIRCSDEPPRHRLYAKLVLTQSGEKQYIRVTQEDDLSYERASKNLKKWRSYYPSVAIEAGYNTNQAIGYNYDRWEKMFNNRQLLCLSILAKRIASIEDVAIRDLFACLFSGTLEFNNQFTSYKGEGTGAVRHMFAHHVLKPERIPLEANPWGTQKSSGAFSTLYKSRIKRALDYAENPFELALEGKKSRKVYGLSAKLGFEIANSAQRFAEGHSVYISCGDSGETDLDDTSVDAIITDPPFFDNVHYSELADFFYVWLQQITGGDTNTTRNLNEVQHGDVDEFTSRLSRVWTECHRVLKTEGLLVFTYHHSRPDGWTAILKSIIDADFVITATHPVKSEMSVAMPKNQAKEPINFDIIVVCRKATSCEVLSPVNWCEAAINQVRRLQVASCCLSRNDILVIVMSQLVRQVSHDATSAISTYMREYEKAEVIINKLYADKRS